MKSVILSAILAALPALVNAVVITNSNFEGIEVGKPFEITWAEAQGPVSLTLKNGESTDLKTVGEITSGQSGDSYTWTPSTSLPTDTYALEINDGTDVNYSEQFQIQGNAASSSTATTTTATTTTASASSTVSSISTSSASSTTFSSSTITRSASSSVSSITSSASESSTSSSSIISSSTNSTTTSSSSRTTSASAVASQTAPPNTNAAQSVAPLVAPMLLALGAAFM
ncbi:hypothetical protein AAE478_000108 [Parahypoxylon ruwenzoriense]